MQPIPVHTVVMYPRPHPDNIAALWLLQEFGTELFPGIREVAFDFWNQVPPGKTAEQWEAEGYLLIDIGGGRFDHHHDGHQMDTTTCATTLVARYLGVDQRPELKKLLEFVRRDDLEGRGIVSKDVIDRAFGLSAIVMNLNRDYPGNPEFVIDSVMRIFHAHYNEEYRRKVVMPKEWEELKREGRAVQFDIDTPSGPLRVVMMESDSKTMVGFVRAVKDIMADVVVQRQSTGHTNIVTRQTQGAPKLDLRPLLAAIRRAEAQKKGMDVSRLTAADWEKPRRLEGIDEWYFDIAANTIQNGGAATANISPTQLGMEEIQHMLTDILPTVVSRGGSVQRQSPTGRPTGTNRGMSLDDLKRGKVDIRPLR